MKFLKNKEDIEALQEVLEECEGDVIIRSNDETEEYNITSFISQFAGIARLCSKEGDNFEFFCMNKNDIGRIMAFFHDVKAC